MNPTRSPKHGHLALAAVLAATIAAAAFFALPSPLNVVCCGLGWLMAAIAWVDARRFLIPDVLSLPAIPAGLLASGSLLDPTQTTLVAVENLVGMLAGGGAFLLIRLAYARLRGREGLGLGDVKLAAAAGAWTGWQGLNDVVLLASLGALAIVAGQQLSGRGRRVNRLMRIPFGAFLAPAIWLVWSLGRLGLAPHMLWGRLGI